MECTHGKARCQGCWLASIHLGWRRRPALHRHLPLPSATQDQMSDRVGLIDNAAPIAGLDSAPQGAGSATTPAQKSIFHLSSHPYVLFFHLFFRGAAIVTYVLCGFFTSSFVFPFVVIVLLLAFDFWTVKNVSGRLLVGLRWWNEIKDDGSNVWVFESAQNRVVNSTDSWVFWTSLYAAPAIWVFFAFICLIRFNITWMLVTFVAIVFNLANVIGYTKCEKDARKKVTNYIASQGMFQSFVGGLVTDRISSMFGGRGSTTNSMV
ncbi:uncharacterized protein BJ171DRAFT_515307 [Polychytrium aggregatum]|uniref:uncharacterized protein n=1 Tax=Polychytrium aggregatum TaxID=110093 RepID=UPI0022FE6689|nr:uncharacterized protein BJ171DRAFT_515307 [Polychytrium aggregatum]KAI9202264.1 hypothetical protein BJ171DRAFT_515307 [Polychytrium aggregatum]